MVRDDDDPLRVPDLWPHGRPVRGAAWAHTQARPCANKHAPFSKEPRTTNTAPSLGTCTCAFSPNSRWKMPKVPGPHTSCVISLSTLVQMFCPGATLALLLCRARIFSVSVCAFFTCARRSIPHTRWTFDD